MLKTASECIWVPPFVVANKPKDKHSIIDPPMELHQLFLVEITNNLQYSIFNRASDAYL